jgi:3-phenylpropionate/cinnamic acid dioxygenase small subunit
MTAATKASVPDDRSDREQITDVLVRYATAIDTRNWPLLRTCFSADVRADYGDIGVWNGVESITQFMATSHEGMHATNHMMSNIVIELDGDEASAASYVHAVLVLTKAPQQWIDVVGRYDDTFVRTSDGWRIRERTYTLSRFLDSDQGPGSEASSRQTRRRR